MNSSISEISKYFSNYRISLIEDAENASDIVVSDSYQCLQFLTQLPYNNIVIRTTYEDFISWSRFLLLAKNSDVQVFIFFVENVSILMQSQEGTHAYLNAKNANVIFLNYEH